MEKRVNRTERAKGRAVPDGKKEKREHFVNRVQKNSAGGQLLNAFF